MCHTDLLRQKTGTTAAYHGSVSAFQELLGYITMTAKQNTHIFHKSNQ